MFITIDNITGTLSHHTCRSTCIVTRESVKVSNMYDNLIFDTGLFWCLLGDEPAPNSSVLGLHVLSLYSQRFHTGLDHEPFPEGVFPDTTAKAMINGNEDSFIGKNGRYL